MHEIELLRPKKCPYKLIRVGGKEDGSYLLPDDLDGIVSCYSPGVFNFKNFEDELANKYQIKSHMCDFSSDESKFKTKLKTGLQTFDKKWLDINNDKDSFTLNEFVTKYNPNLKDDLILQMDIEGAEYRNLLDAKITLLNRFRIIILELHSVLDILETKKGNDIRKLLNKLNKTHLCIHAHPNNCGRTKINSHTGMNIPDVIELTYLRRDRFFEDLELIDVQLPHYLDIHQNIISMKPIHLNIFWLNSKKRNIKSKIKIIKDYFHFYNYKFKQLVKYFLKPIIKFKQ